MATAFGEPLAPRQRQKTSVECEHCKKNGKAAMFHQPKSCKTLHPTLKRRPKAAASGCASAKRPKVAAPVVVASAEDRIIREKCVLAMGILVKDIIYRDPKLLPRYAPLVQLVKLFGGDPSLCHTLTALSQSKAPLVLVETMSLCCLKKLTSGVIGECVMLLSAQPEISTKACAMSQQGVPRKRIKCVTSPCIAWGASFEGC